jgi:hypothetical protein
MAGRVDPFRTEVALLIQITRVLVVRQGSHIAGHRVGLQPTVVE